MKKWIRASLGVALLWPAVAAVAQNTNSGDIRGVVTDSSGAIIPGATVKIDDVDKGISHTYTTDGAGLYDTGPIVPDHYLITVTAPGFQSYVRGPITLQVAIVTVDAALSVGAAQQQVFVKTDVPLLQTETGAQTQTLESKQLLQLPQVGADWQNFVTLLPGASTVNPNNRPGQTASINGNLPYNTVLADGATTTLPMSQNSDVMVLETVSEVKIDDSAFSAQYGIGGATFNQISKGGTNQFHGAAYEYFQNDALNAADYAFGAKNTVGLVRYNNFGFSVGGPIWRDRVFFYFNYDKTINPGTASTGFENVPTSAMLGGDFTGLPTIYDPTTQTVDASGIVHRKSFAEEYGANKIPATMIDPVAAAISKYYPAPNAGSGISNNFFYNVPSANPFTKYFGRLDYQINQNNHIIASETESDNPAQYRNQGICPVGCQNGDVSRDNAQVSWVWTISPRTINEARMGFTDQLNFFTPFSINQGFPAKLGWKFAKADTFPDIQISGNGDLYELQPQSNAVYKEFVFDPSDVVTLIRGRHVLHFGGEFLINRADSTAWGNTNAGTMAYTGVYTQADNTGTNTNTGMGFADFLLGYTSSWNAKVTPEWGGRLKSPQFFVQDDIKLRPNLTLNVGLRWQGMTGWHEVKGNMASFDPTVTNPADGSKGAMWYGVTKANGRDSLQAPNWSTWLPRVGFSYGHGPKTVFRGGIGLYGYTWSDDTYGPGMGAAFGSNGNIADATNGINPVVILSSDGSTNYQGPGGKSVNQGYIASPTTPDALNGQNGVTYQAYHTPVPKILEWNFEVQQEIGTNMVMTMGYVASHGWNLLFPVDINQVPEAALGPNDIGLRPYPLFGAINGGSGAGGTNNAVSNYNSLQTTIQKRLSNGLQFNANYVWAHMLDTIDSSGWGSTAGDLRWQNAYSPAANYGAANFDVRNAFKAAAIYDLPVGKGRQFLNNNWLVDEAIGGWQVAPSIIWSSGSPYTVIMSSDNSFSQTGPGKANGQQYARQIGSPNPSHKDLQHWFNTASFIQPDAGTFGNAQRNNLYGPQYLLVNAAVGKTFHIPWENIGLEIRASANNVLNHPSFSPPNATINGGTEGQINSLTVKGRTMQLYGRISF